MKTAPLDSGHTYPSALIDGEIVSARITLSGEEIGAVEKVQATPPKSGPVLLPAAIDAHVHLNDPGRTEWEGFESGTRAAAAGGIALLGDMPLNSSPVVTSITGLQEKRDAAGNKLCIDVAPYAGLIEGNAPDLPALLDAGVLAVKAFLCHSGLDEFPAAREEDLRLALPLLAERNVPLLAHAEIVPTGHATNARITTLSDWAATRPPAMELEAINLLIGLCREYNAPIHIVHLAAAEALPAIRAAKAEGLPLTVETCPHYLTFDLENSPETDTLWKCAPPIRGRRNRESLWEAILDGTIDIVASDHSPCDPMLKHRDTGDFSRAWGGIAGLQFLLPALWTGGKERGLTVARMVELVCTNPAKLLRIDDRLGTITAGKDASLIMFDPGHEWEVTKSDILHRHPITPYLGQPMKGRVETTMLRGRIVHNVDTPLENYHEGRILLRKGN